MRVMQGNDQTAGSSSLLLLPAVKQKRETSHLLENSCYRHKVTIPPRMLQ
jgi:hypothetical protein